MGDDTYFVACRRYVLGCLVTLEKVTVYMYSIKEPIDITSPQERVDFLRFLEGYPPPRDDHDRRSVPAEDRVGL